MNNEDEFNPIELDDSPVFYQGDQLIIDMSCIQIPENIAEYLKDPFFKNGVVLERDFEYNEIKNKWEESLFD